MTQFSLDEYLKNPDRKVITRSGCPVRIIGTNRITNRCDKPIVALVYNAIEKYEDCYTYTAEGKVSFVEDEDDLDLFFAPIKHEGWQNIYAYDDGGYYSGNIYRTKQETKEAVAHDIKGYVTTIKIEWEE